MTIRIPPAPAAWAALAAILVSAGPAPAQDEPAPPAPAPMALPEMDLDEGEAAPKLDVPAFGDSAQPPGTYPEPEPYVPPEPEAAPCPEGMEPAEGEEKCKEAEPAGAGAEVPPSEAAPVGEAEGADIELDAAIPTAAKKRRMFQIQGLYELHFNLISDDYSANDWLSYYMLRGNVDVTKNNQLSLRMDLEQRFIADPGESGLWFGDIRLYYSRKFLLPIPKFPIPGKVSFYLTAPTSRQSIRRSYITMPTVVLALAPSLGPVTLVANGYFRYCFAKYAESDERGTPNTQLMAGLMFQLIYIPVDWFAPSVAWVSNWSRPYSTRENEIQAWQQTYYWEVALNFTLPMPEKAPSIDLTLAYAQGSNVLEDGVYRLYFAKRDQSELYFGINMMY